MFTKRYNITSRHIWYNPLTNAVSDARNDKNQIKFDSKAEFDFYRKLQPLASTFGFDIYKDCKLEFNQINWLVDFKLVFPIEKSLTVNRFLSHLNGKPAVDILPIIYIEYKGVLTPDSVSKLDAIAGTAYNDNLIMVSDKPCGYVRENHNTMEITNKVIFSTRFFLNLLTQYLLKG